MVDHKSCMDCPDDEISTNGICMVCTDPTQVPNIAMTACVGMFDHVYHQNHMWLMGCPNPCEMQQSWE